MTQLPAPYELAQQDDLAAALGAGLAVTCAGITGWMLGSFSYRGLDSAIRAGVDLEDWPAPAALTIVGWGAATVLMVLGALLLLFRRGRGLLVFGALVSVVITAIAQFSYDIGTVRSPVEQWPLYWGGVVVLVLALLPATKRWVRRAPAPAAIGTAPQATVWPGT
ncbi:hypothetical protein GIS00_02610 [Nakamurella sp. YIM 132087]|uniref:Uncharacterized protein n=1 Tax=Nakamurella alba TaxID=2665158 RepID=A0A7K1FFJ1_9ACTN|nr:hypothetical protein [Nakamurella alba]MTD12836.1 hypothetical protein [Nakamurella alba]